MRLITRTFLYTTYYADAVKYENNNLVSKELEPFSTCERLSENQVKKRFAEQLGEEKYSAIVLKDSIVSEKQYGISKEDFIKNAKLIENQSEDQE